MNEIKNYIITGVICFVVGCGITFGILYFAPSIGIRHNYNRTIELERQNQKVTDELQSVYSELVKSRKTIESIRIELESGSGTIGEIDDGLDRIIERLRKAKIDNGKK